jgi:predicted heme/steroid binding protein
MTALFGNLMSVPVRRGLRPFVGPATIAHGEYGLLVNRFELARYDGCIDQLPVLIGYRGRVYDITGRDSLEDEISWQRYAGRDCTTELSRHPRFRTLLAGLPCVGLLED